MTATSALRNISKGIALSVVAIVVLFIGIELVLSAMYGRPLIYEYDEEALYVIKPSQTGFPLYYLPSAHINTVGTRGRELMSNPVRRIVVIGASDVFGQGLTDENTFPVQLERRLRENYKEDVEVVNAGVLGYGLFQMVALLKKKMQQWRPNEVVLLYPLGYVYRQPPTGDPGIKQRMLVPLRYLTTYHFTKVLVTEAAARFGVTVYTMPNVREAIELPPEGVYPKLWNEERQHFIDLFNVCRENEIKLVVVAYGPLRDDREKHIESNLRSLCRDYGVSLYEFYKSLHEDKYFVKRDRHPSAEYYNEILQKAYSEGFDAEIMKTK